MASLSLFAVPTTTTTSLSSRSPLFSKSSTHRLKVSCKLSADDHSENNPKLILPMQNVDRRNMLLGLGGLYGAANLTNIGSALAYPITAPENISNCVPADVGFNTEDAVRGSACCPPTTQTTAVPYVLPEVTELRVRPAADRLTPEYIAKYQAAVAAMKALPEEDPRSWKQQGKIHCAYCNGAYSQYMNGHPELKIQVHNNSLFFPFHRWYLYFYERILGSLINDPTFGLPYWNWDNPKGMLLPEMLETPYPNPNPDRPPNPRFNPLFDPYRNVTHLPPAIIDLDRGNAGGDKDCVAQISENLTAVYDQMIADTTANPDAFFGTNPNPDDPTTILAGRIESGVHSAVHVWVGNPRMANNEDMGNFYSAGYDPAFYLLHSNVDRMWQIWNELDIRNVNPSNDDWLNASFVFYDENQNLVRVYNRDCVDIEKMGYTFEPSRLTWLQARPIPRNKASNVAAKSVGVVKKVEEIEFPVKLDKTVKVLVKRPATNRSADDKKKASEMLFLEEIKYNGEQFFQFDVLVNDVDDGIETTRVSSEFAGTFAQVPHGLGGGHMLMSSGTAFGLTQILEDLEAEGDEYVLVTLVPREGAEDATISNIKIKLVPLAN
ncbi:putative catechol oxidase [Helianthus annuus]|nr:putative catechol oxidase [Helianthus annuus]